MRSLATLQGINRKGLAWRTSARGREQNKNVSEWRRRKKRRRGGVRMRELESKERGEVRKKK